MWRGKEQSNIWGETFEVNEDDVFTQNEISLIAKEANKYVDRPERFNKYLMMKVYGRRIANKIEELLAEVRASKNIPEEDKVFSPFWAEEYL